MFAPAGASRIARVAGSLLAGRDGALPRILVGPGRQAMAEELRVGLYADAPERVTDLSDLVGMPGADVEDLLPPDLLADQMDRMERRPETRLGDVIATDQPFLPQVARWAASQRLALPDDWRRTLARRVRDRALDLGPEGFSPVRMDRWSVLFGRLADEDEDVSQRESYRAA